MHFKAYRDPPQNFSQCVVSRLTGLASVQLVHGQKEQIMLSQQYWYLFAMHTSRYFRTFESKVWIAYVPTAYRLEGFRH